MRKKGLLIVIGVILILCSFFIIKGKYLNKVETPQQVIESFYKYLNEKNIAKVQNYLIVEKKDSFKNLENLESIKIITSNEEPTSNIKEGYIQSHKEKNLKIDNIRVFRVEYLVNYKDDTKEPLENGKHEMYYTLIRKSIDSPWLIAEWGF